MRRQHFLHDWDRMHAEEASRNLYIHSCTAKAVTRAATHGTGAASAEAWNLVFHIVVSYTFFPLVLCAKYHHPLV